MTKYTWKNQMRNAIVALFIVITSFPVESQVLDSAFVEELEKPGTIESDLNNSLPKKESLFRSVLFPEDYDDFKEDLYRKTKLKFNFSYQGLVMLASNTIADPNWAGAGLALFDAEWTPLNFDKDYQGGIIASYNLVHTYGNANQPPLFFFNTGTMFAHDALYLDVDPFSANLYWEQWFTKDRFFIRIGQHVPPSVIDFSRFADVRTSVSNPAIGFPASYIPFGPPAFGITAKLLPKNPTGFYLVGHVSDPNSIINQLDWGNILETGDVFLAGELGHNWIRFGENGLELDHIHLLVFNGDSPSKKPFPRKSGWGFKLSGEKQLGKWVTLLSYAYNTAQGGGFGFTALEHVLNVGGAFSKPLGIKGEAFLAFTWAKEIDGEQCGIVPCEGRDQTMMEAYWKILVFPQLWVTPGFQMHFNPVNNPNAKLLSVPLLKFRTFL